MPTIVIALFDHSLPSAITGVIDMFSLSNLSLVQSAKGMSGTWPPDIITASHDGKPVTDGQGKSMAVDADFASITACDAVIVPGFAPNAQGCPPAALVSEQAKRWLIRQYQHKAMICGSCSGVFALGEANLLANHRCTTTWWLHDELKQRFPTAKAEWASELIADRRIVTAGGPMSWINITLHIVKELAGADMAKIMSDLAVVDTQPKSQNLYAPEGYINSTNPFLAKAEFTIRQAHLCNISAQGLANAMSVSQRTLHRKLLHLTGETPKKFIDRVRIEQACTLLNTGKKSVKSIALALGYSDDTVFRRLFRRRMGITPTAYRQRLIQ